MSAFLLTMGFGLVAWLLLTARFFRMAKANGWSDNADTAGRCWIAAAPFAMIAAGLVGWIVGL